MNAIRTLLILIMLGSAMLLSGCAADDGGNGGGAAQQASDTTSTDASEFEVLARLGGAQKGPFVLGSQVQVQELDSNLEPTGTVFNVETKDDEGNFNFPTGVSSQYVEVLITGHYYDEIAGDLSTSQITVRTVSDTGSPVVMANLMTSLISQRVKALSDSGEAYDDALAQAQTELKRVFGMADYGTVADADLDFDQTELTSNRMLLAVNNMLLQVAHNRTSTSVDAVLSSIVATIRNDLADNGRLDDTGLVNEIWDVSNTLNVGNVRSALASHYGMGVADIPDFSGHLDRDRDRVPESVDDNVPDGDVCFDHILNRPLNEVVTTDTITISGITEGSTVEFEAHPFIYSRDYETYCLRGCEGDWDATVLVNGNPIDGHKTRLSNGDVVQIRTRVQDVPLSDNVNAYGETERVEVEVRIGDTKHRLWVMAEPANDPAWHDYDYYYGEVVRSQNPAHLDDPRFPDGPVISGTIPPACGEAPDYGWRF